MTRTRVAVVGCGRWGPHHIRVFNSMPGCEVVAAVDTDPDRLAWVRQAWPRTLCTAELSEGLAAADAAVITTPMSTHSALVREVLAQGKHVLCEKPLCETSVEGEALLALARERRAVLMVGHVFLFNPGIVKLKELLTAGELGTVCYLSAVRTSLGPFRSDANVAYDLAVHDVAIFNWLLDAEPECVSAMGAIFLRPGVEDVAFISLRYPGNRIANITTSWLNPKKVRQLTLVGSEKMVTWDDLELTTPVAIYDRGARTTPHSGEFGEYLRIAFWDADVRLPKIEAEEPLKVQAQYFLNAVDGRRPLERSSAEFAVGVIRTLEAVTASLKASGRPVAVAG
jgi:predicted dehydrogenase